MHNIKWIRDNFDAFDEKMMRRGLSGVAGKVKGLDEGKRQDVSRLQELQQRSNQLAKEIGALMGQGKKEEAAPLMAESKQVKADIAALKDAAEANVKGESNPLEEYLATLPNILDQDVPEGKSEDDNKEIRSWGDVPSFDFVPKEHFDLGEGLEAGTVGKQLDFEQAVNMSGSRFAVLKGDLALLERALGNWLIDMQTQEFGFELVSPPLLVSSDAMYGTSQLPKFAEDAFQTTRGDWLISTSEIALVNVVREQILDEQTLPYRFTALTPCFRSEAGSAGRDTRGLIRMHQFYKVEMVTVTTPEESADEHERMTGYAEKLLQMLKLPYRVMLLCAGDTGFGARKTYDLEVWLPGQEKYREISSCSNCGDFQARRMNTRCRKSSDKETRFVHTLNGSGLPLGRTLVAIMENYQQANGHIKVPEVLQPYMNGKKRDLVTLH